MRVIKFDEVSVMYIYQITNLINNKIYIGQTNNVKNRWSQHKNCHDPTMAIARAIKKYGADNYKIEILDKNIPIEEIDELEKKVIQEKNSLVPNGYNIALGGQGARGVSKFGADNSNSHLTEEEAQYILDNRNIPMYVLYDKFSEKITYNQFKRIYNHKVYTNLTPHSDIYPYNFEFSNQFTSGGLLGYDEVVSLRQRYAKGEYWKDVYEDYKHLYKDPWTFWNIYYGNRYKLVMPEVFTDEMRHYHSSLGKQGQRNSKAKLTKEDVINIRNLHKQNVPNKQIYAMYPQVSTTTIRSIINGTTWKSLL